MTTTEPTTEPTAGPAASPVGAPATAAAAPDEPGVGSLSTQPAPVDRDGRRYVGGFGRLRRGWRRLTSMRTALILLFLLALAAVPGSLLPQRPLNPAKVDRYLAQHGSFGRLLDRLGGFDVFGTPWFAAIYLLLFVSLVGCLVPRIRLHARALRAAPPATPRRLDRLPAAATYEVDGSPAEHAAAARRVLRRWRAVTRDEPAGVVTVAAEKGYLRETGNLLFHVALTVLLVGVAAGRLTGYQGTVLVEEGKGFCNSVALYDSFRAGRLVAGSLTPFCVDRLDRFTATYEADGTPALFRADIEYSVGTDGPAHRYPLEVNHPLRLDGVRVYLLSHGFSPRFTVRTPSGQVFRDVSAPFLPQDPQLLSEGVVKLPDARPQQLALAGLFAPTAAADAAGKVYSAAPQPLAPGAAIVVYRGDLGIDSGRPQSVYTVDQTQLDRGALVEVARANLVRGQVLELDDGTQITFNGYLQWATVQVSRDPGQRIALGAAGAIVVGLLLSLSVRRRRVWLRLTPSGDGTTPARTVVGVGGLARTDAGSFASEFEQLVARLREPPRAGRKD
jgi:cytochrome c biogenesis protein